MKTLVIDKKDLIYNIEKIKGATSAKIIAVLKCNAYGMDIVQYANILAENGIEYFAVSDFDEAISLRDSGFKKDLLLLSPVEDSIRAKALTQTNITATVADETSAEALSDAAKELGTTAKAHLKVDTGFGRFGVDSSYANDIAELVETYKNIDYEGIFSHFSFSFEKKNKYTKEQFSNFTSLLKELKDKGISFKTKHIANSSAFIKYPETHLDAVRIGSAFLGRLAVNNSLGLKKLAYLESNVEYIKVLPQGHNVGYANTYKAKRDTKIAIVPVGYADGYSVEKSKDTFRFKDILRYIFHDMKSINKKSYVSVNGKSVPVIGRVGMYNIVLDITNTDIKIGDVVKININPILIDSSIRREYR